jgi:glycosyltransferase involved in cell wall biosynthesis
VAGGDSSREMAREAFRGAERQRAERVEAATVGSTSGSSTGDDVAMRLLFVASTLAIGGAERQYATLVPALQSRGFDGRVVTLAHEGAFFYELRERGVDVTCAHMTRRTDVAGLRRAFAALAGGVDLVVSQSVSAQVVGTLMSLKERVPHVTIDHTPPELRLRPHQRALLRGVARKADLLVIVSPRQYEPLLSFGFRRERIAVIPNGVEELRPTLERAEVRNQLGLSDTDVVAILVAVLRPQKQAHVFVEAMARAHTHDDRVRGLVVGVGPEQQRVSEAVARSGGAVKMLGARLDVADLVNASDIACLSSFGEALPLALLEGMSLGKPVVSTDVGGVSEAVVDGETGLLVPPGEHEALAEAVLALARDPGLRRRLGDAGRARHRERFSAEAMVDSYAEAFRQVLGARHEAGPAE